ncbi:MAG: molybdate ABC transporter permease subunit, partial [Oxalobacteraceae bacterium]
MTPTTPRKRRVLPGFGLSLGVTLTYFGLIVLLPVTGLLAKAATVPPELAWRLFTDPLTLAAFRVSFVASGLAALISVPIGVLLAWVLERYRFPGRRLLDAAVDLPFALPTAVAGIALTT